MRRELIRFGVGLAFVACSALFPGTASRAGLGTMFTQSPCPELIDVANAYDFRDSFVGNPQCETLCRQATASCKQAMKAAAACQFAFASDWTAFDSAVDCDSREGADKKDCKAGWSSDLKAWRAQIKRSRDQQGVPTCNDFLNNGTTGCLRRCSGV